MTYADAVDRHQINAGQAVALNDWAPFLNRAGWRLAGDGIPDGSPATVTNDQIVTGMIEQSDDAAPDYLLQSCRTIELAEPPA